METTQNATNVAQNSTKGHFVKNAKKVILLNKKKEAFFIEGEAIITSENHGTAGILSNSLCMPQQVYNPYTKSLERSKD